MHVDASDSGTGTFLAHEHDAGELGIIAYFNRRSQPAEDTIQQP